MSSAALGAHHDTEPSVDESRTYTMIRSGNDSRVSIREMLLVVGRDREVSIYLSVYLSGGCLGS